MTDVLAFFAALALAACAASEPAAAPSRGATVTRADGVTAIVRTPAGDVAFLPSEAP